MVPLNPEAPEFFPSKHHKLHQVQPTPSSNLSTSPFPHQYCYFFVSSFPSRETHPVYCPTSTLPLPSTSIYDARVTNTCHKLLASEAKPPHLDELNPVESHAVHLQKEKVVTGARASCSKGLEQKHVFQAFISCGGSMDGRRSDGLKLKAYSRRRKGENVAQHSKCDHIRNRSDIIKNTDEQYLRAFPKKKRCYPIMPVRVDGDETTVMIKNIPSKYTRDMLVEFLDNHCMLVNLSDEEAGKENEERNILAFDFVYLPIDFKSGMNKGYAFVNFTNPKAAWKFLLTASNMKWGFFESNKIREVVAARLQGKERLERHFEAMNFPCDSEDVLPISFSPPRDGVIKGEHRTMGKLIKRQQI